MNIILITILFVIVITAQEKETMVMGVEDMSPGVLPTYLRLCPYEYKKEQLYCLPSDKTNVLLVPFFIPCVRWSQQENIFLFTP